MNPPSTATGQQMPAEPLPVRKAVVVADEQVSLRHRATPSSDAKVFNGATVSKDDIVVIMLEEKVDGITFYYIQVDGTRKKGFVKAEYVAESAV